MDKIVQVNLVAYQFEVKDLSLGAHAALGVSNYVFEKGGKLPVTRHVVKITASSHSQ